MKCLKENIFRPTFVDTVKIRKRKMLEFYPNPMLTHQGLLQGHHHDSISSSMSCNGHGRTGICRPLDIN